MTPECQALVMLGSLVGMPREGGAAKPLTPSELADMKCDLGSLLGKSASEIGKAAGVGPDMAERMASLLDRGGSLAVELSRLEDRGIWMLTRLDDGYPPRLVERLGLKAPAVLTGAGPIANLSAPGLAVVGARDIDAAGEEFAGAIGRLCAECGWTVYSGAARGADAFAMAGSLQHGGSAVGVLAESLEKSVQRHDMRQAVLDEVLAVVTPFHPASPFSVGNAMARNKLIYCLADYALVVSTTEGQGGTWSGAIENLSAGWTPMFVRSGANAPPGNAALAARGAVAVSEEELVMESDLPGLLAARASHHTSPQRGLFDH